MTALSPTLDADQLRVLLARVGSKLGLAQSSTELAIAPYVRPDRYARACEELSDLWEEVADARR